VSASQSCCQSLNVLRVGDILWCNLYGWRGNRERYAGEAFLARVTGFPTSQLVAIEAVVKSDDPLVDNEFNVPFHQLRRNPELVA